MERPPNSGKTILIQGLGQFCTQQYPWPAGSLLSVLRKVVDFTSVDTITVLLLNWNGQESIPVRATPHPPARCGQMLSCRTTHVE